MNCKKDDLAFIVNATCSPENNGRLVRVVRRVCPGELFTLSGGYCVRLRTDRTADWIVQCESPLRFRATYSVRETFIRPIADRLLRPIRDPGDDAVDESLSWLPVPTKEHA